MSKVIVTGFDSSKVTEKQTVTVKYAGKTATFDVEIRNIIIPEPEPTHADGLANEMAEDGKWYVYRDNAVDYGYTGLAANEYGIIYITEAMAAECEKIIEKFQEQLFPAVIRIPGVSGNTGDGVEGVKKSVEQAVGSDILFGSET